MLVKETLFSFWRTRSCSSDLYAGCLGWAVLKSGSNGRWEHNAFQGQGSGARGVITWVSFWFNWLLLPPVTSSNKTAEQVGLHRTQSLPLGFQFVSVSASVSGHSSDLLTACALSSSSSAPDENNSFAEIAWPTPTRVQGQIPNTWHVTTHWT